MDEEDREVATDGQMAGRQKGRGQRKRRRQKRTDGIQEQRVG